MIVFEYFYNKMEVFGPRMDNMTARDLKAKDEAKVSLFSLSVHLSLDVFLSDCLSVCQWVFLQLIICLPVSLSSFLSTDLSTCLCLLKCLSVMLHPPSPPSGTSTQSLTSLSHQCLLPRQTAE